MLQMMARWHASLPPLRRVSIAPLMDGSVRRQFTRILSEGTPFYRRTGASLLMHDQIVSLPSHNTFDFDEVMNAEVGVFTSISRLFVSSKRRASVPIRVIHIDRTGT